MSRGGRKKGAETLTQVMARLLEKELVPDLIERARMPGVEAALRAKWEREKAARRTADAFEIWVKHAVEQVGAAWVLSVAFVRTLEDRGLLERRRIAGHEAYDSEHGFFRLFPALGPRDYLLTIFRELSRLPGAEDLLGARHNPAWRLAPSNAAAQKLLDAWRKDDEARTPLWTFEESDTRFLGDLYQDLSADARERFALLQTPEFVERFILKLTLDPAIEEFGLEAVRLIDPTCGSGHFLLGAYDRLFDLRLAREPGVDRRAHALAGLAQVHGVDLNPYAVAIARFRLTLSFLAKAEIAKLSGAPKLPLSLAVADSLLVAARGTTRQLAEEAKDRTAWGFDLFDFEDEAEARRILGQGYHAVVGNPPYITCKDAALRDQYRELYPRSAAGKFALAAPFTERFFQLGVEGGFVGLINANSFMKREFGKKLIEEVLPNVDLTHVIDTSGAFIPGHGTPTVILAGRNRTPGGERVRAALGRRGEATTPQEPEKGVVWSSISGHLDEVGFENEYVSVADVERASLANHPWSLGGGGAADLKEALEARAEQRLGAFASAIGISAVTGEDDVYVLPNATVDRLSLERVRRLVLGEEIRDWSLADGDMVVFPYDENLGVLPAQTLPGIERFLWSFRVLLKRRKRFGTPMLERGLTWYELQELYTEKLLTPLSIAFAEVATHNHFILVRGGNIFNRTAPIIKLPKAAGEGEHLALLGYLNSSTACFWMKQACHAKTNHTEERPEKFEPGTLYYAFNSTALKNMPLPPRSSWPSFTAFARAFEDLALEEAAWSPRKIAERVLAEDGPPEALVSEAEAADSHIRRRRVALQEDLDWFCYGVWGMAAVERANRVFDSTDGISPEERPFACAGPWQALSEEKRARLVARRASMMATRDLALIENAEMKRRWIGAGRGSFGLEARSFGERCADEVLGLLWGLAEEELRNRGAVITVRAAMAAMQDRSPQANKALGWLAGSADDHDYLARALARSSIPYCAALRFTDAGMEKRALWECTWDLQRREDSGERLDAPIPVPPKYDQKDYRDPIFWRLRGKLDVPKERFISYPGAERDDDKSPIIGWAGWDHLQRAQALAALYQERKAEAWTKERLVPLLAGLLELVPWLKQWHNEPAAGFGGQRLGDYFAQYVESEAGEISLTLDDLSAWRPPARGKGKRK